MKKLWTLLVIVAALVAAYFVADAVLRQQARRAEAAYESDGHGVSDVELARLFDAGSSAAADSWLAAARLMDTGDIGRVAYYETLGWRASPAEARRYVADKHRVIELAARAAALGPADYGMDPRDGWAAHIAETPRWIGPIRSTMNLAARLLAEDGKPDSALAVLTACLGTIDAFGEPVLIYHLVNMLALDTTLSRVAAVAPRAGAPAIRQTVAELQTWDLHAAFVRAMAAEVAMTRVSLVGGQVVFDPQAEKRRAPLYSLPLVRSFALAHYLGFARAQLKVSGLAWHEAAPALESLGRELPRTLPGRLGMTLPNAGLFVQRTARLEARRLATLAGLRTLLAGRPGRWAPDAGGLLDPYTGKELLCRELTDGFVIYSVGPDGKDDGGDGLTDVSFRAMPWPNDRGGSIVG